jgi:hypothetical protein
VDPPSGSFTGVVDEAELCVEVPSGWTGWWSALAPRPDDPDERIRQHGLWLRNAYIGGYTGPVARLDLEAEVGGNPSSNVGVDYARQLRDSEGTAQVGDAYRRAGLDLSADLAALAVRPASPPTRPPSPSWSGPACPPASPRCRP